MKILALEFSSAQRSVALIAGAAPPPPGTLPGQSAPVTLEHEVVETGGRSTRAFEMLVEVLRQARVEREEVECLAVGLGPGSYTGIRAALALAQGWQLARSVKLLGVSSAECLATQAQAEGIVGRVAIVIDAQRGEFYLANYELEATGCRPERPLRLASRLEVEACQRAGELLVGPELAACFPEGRPLFPRAATLGRLALGRTNFVAAQTLEPIYLRQTSFVKSPPPRVLSP